jgi:HPr kinase/phosphorylase
MSVTVAEFCQAAQKQQINLVPQAGELYMRREIPEIAINRPGLALAAFYKYFANRRVQVFGLAESEYIKSLPESERKRRIEGLFQQNIPCLVLTRGRKASTDLRAMAEKYKTPVLRSPSITGNFINQATLVLEDLVAPTTRRHGTMLDILGVGVMIEGPSGIGKSEAALGLIERGHSLVTDDLTILRKINTGALVGSAPDMTRYHMEIRGLGVINVPSLFGMASITRDKQLDMIIGLYHPEPGVEEDRTGTVRQSRTILDVEVPLVTLPVRAGRDMSNVIEVAAMNQKLRMLGHDSAAGFNKDIIRRLKKERNSPEG